MPDTALFHLLGFATGGALYALLAAMVVQRGSRSGMGSRLALATALLGLVWNAGALVLYAVRDFGMDIRLEWLSAAAFAALGFLPAVVVHAALQGLATRLPRLLVAGAYTLSGAAGVGHIMAAATSGAIPSPAALVALTVGYVMLTGAIATQHQRVGGGRALTAVALAVFAVSAFHLGVHAEEGESWFVALVGHHASIPLALVILYQDYRFALADVFLKRALSLIALVALAATLWSVVGAPLLTAIGAAAGDERSVGVLLTLMVATALAYPVLRRSIAVFVDRVVLRRADYAQVRAEITRDLERAENAPAALALACAHLASALGASRVEWREDETPADERIPAGDAAGVVRVPTTDAPSFLLEVGELAGGRRLLSDDLALLDATMLLTGRRLDALRVSEERYERDLREAEMRRLASEAELSALRAQLNPHFLFNALNTLGWLMQAAPSRAQEVLRHLTGLLRAVLYRSTSERCTLREELELVRAYLAIESARFEERLRVVVDVPGPLLELLVPPLILQPLVENAVKHGIAPSRAGGEVRVTAVLATEAPVSPGAGPTLELTVHDSGVGESRPRLGRESERGVGLANLQRRLDRYYGSRALLRVHSVAGEGTSARVWLPAESGERSPGAPTSTRDDRGSRVESPTARRQELAG